MNNFVYKQIDWQKVTTGNVILHYSSGELIPNIEIAVERAEANRLGYPKDYRLATHIAIPLEFTSDYTLTKNVGFLWWKREKKLTLAAGKYVFEEQISGVEENPISKYYNDDTVEIRRRKIPFTPEQRLVFQESVLRAWHDSYSYGWLSFFTQPAHTILDKDLTTKVIQGAKICSEYFACAVNDACLANLDAEDFTDPANTNPFEVQINENWERDITVQPA